MVLYHAAAAGQYPHLFLVRVSEFGLILASLATISNNNSRDSHQRRSAIVRADQRSSMIGECRRFARAEEIQKGALFGFHTFCLQRAGKCSRCDHCQTDHERLRGVSGVSDAQFWMSALLPSSSVCVYRPEPTWTAWTSRDRTLMCMCTLQHCHQFSMVKVTLYIQKSGGSKEILYYAI
jgi:hypothetical protein